ncbi:MAG: branched-chain amino acid ABC transporter permease [Nitrospirae bacterium]|nr:branched-chain amino acid ABC transporter permease [Candidatus Manganitrophaceae bacterium]
MGWRDAGKLAAVLAFGGVLWQGVLVWGRSAPVHSSVILFQKRVSTFRAGVVKGNRTWFVGGGSLLLLILPVFLNNYYIDILSLAGLYAILAAGLNITVGCAGLLDLGYAAFYGIGAYIYGLLSTGIGLSFWLGLPLGGAVAALFGVILGTITLRLRGDYLAIVTLGFVQIVYLVLNNWDGVTHGPNGILNIGRPALFGFSLHQPVHFYYLVLLLLALIAVALHRLTRSQIGRAWIAIREDELAAAAMGIDTTRMKVFAFALGAGIAGIAGVFFAAKYTFISPESFTFLESVRVLSMVVLGGMGSLPGAILGAFLLTLLPELLRGLASYRMLIFGAALVIMMVFRPQGLLGKRN